MKFVTSYFAMLRHFPRDVIPISTAMRDPWWFHSTKKENYSPKGVYMSSKGILHGLRAESFVPIACDNGFGPKAFIDEYEKQLSYLDFHQEMKKFAQLELAIKRDYPALSNFDSLTFALMVYETPDNPFSEREMIQKLFARHGVSCPEWQKK